MGEAKTFCEQAGYPCLIRPSYVLSGAAMKVVFNDEVRRTPPGARRSASRRGARGMQRGVAQSTRLLPCARLSPLATFSLCVRSAARMLSSRLPLRLAHLLTDGCTALPLHAVCRRAPPRALAGPRDLPQGGVRGLALAPGRHLKIYRERKGDRGRRGRDERQGDQLRDRGARRERGRALWRRHARAARAEALLRDRPVRRRTCRAARARAERVASARRLRARADACECCAPPMCSPCPCRAYRAPPLPSPGA